MMPKQTKPLKYAFNMYLAVLFDGVLKSALCWESVDSMSFKMEKIANLFGRGTLFKLFNNPYMGIEPQPRDFARKGLDP